MAGRFCEPDDDSDVSLPHEHLHVKPLICVPCVATIAFVAASFVSILHTLHQLRRLRSSAAHIAETWRQQQTNSPADVWINVLSTTTYQPCFYTSQIETFGICGRRFLMGQMPFLSTNWECKSGILNQRKSLSGWFLWDKAYHRIKW